PWWQHRGGPWEQQFRGLRLRLKLSAQHADGLLGAYVDVESWYRNLVRAYPTLQHSYGQLSPPSVYQALRRLADGYPDATTGANTAISSALAARFAQVFLLHPQAKKGP